MKALLSGLLLLVGCADNPSPQAKTAFNACEDRGATRNQGMLHAIEKIDQLTHCTAVANDPDRFTPKERMECARAEAQRCDELHRPTATHGSAKAAIEKIDLEMNRPEQR